MMNSSQIRDFPGSVIVEARSPVALLDFLAVELSFYMQQKNSYGYVVFLKGREKSTISQDELFRSFDGTRNLFLMDYVDPRTNFVGRITARVLRTRDLNAALEAYSLYRQHLWYPENYENNLRLALSSAEKNDSQTVEISLSY